MFFSPIVAKSGSGLLPGIWVQGFCPQLGGVGPCPAQCIWQGSGFAADQTNAMLATSNGGDKSSRNRESLRLSGITADAEEFSIYGREIKCFFCWLLRNFSPFTQRFFGVPAWGWYHYPRRSFHAVETLGARGSRRLIRRFYAAPEFAQCGLNIPAAGTHATPAPNRAHSGSHGETRRVIRADGDDVFGSGIIDPIGPFQADQTVAVALAEGHRNAVSP